MSCELYRNTTVGNALKESLDELIQCGKITTELAVKVFLQFDKCINKAMATRVSFRLLFKARKLNTYRAYDNIWTIILNDVEFREIQEVGRLAKLKIVAFDAKNVNEAVKKRPSRK